MIPVRSIALARPPTLLGIALLAGSYFLLGRLALLLAIPPGFASSVWPAAGLALMALLLAGRRLWPGVVLGSFLVNFFTTIEGAGGAELLRSALVPAVVGGGAALQAVLGAWAIGRWVGFPANLSRSRDVLLLLALGGPLSCLVSASVGIAALLASGVIAPVEAAFHWWTWWVGDSIGVFVVVPLVLAFLTEPDQQGRSRRLRVGLPLVVTTGAVVILFVYAREQERHQVELELGLRALSLAHAFEKYTEHSLDDVSSIEGLFVASEQVSRREFSQFARRILRRNSTFQALSWNPLVPHAERPDYEASGRADGLVGYGFTETTTGGALGVAAERPDYVVVHFLEPMSGNRQALGFDISSNPVRRAAIERARDTGQLAVTSGIRLVQETGEQTGVLLLMPVYARGSQLTTVEERRRSVRGYTTGVVRLGDGLQAALADLPLEGFVATLLDLSASPNEEILARVPAAADEEASALLEWSFDWEVGGRIWSLRLEPTQDLLASYRRWYSWLVLAGGLGLVSLLGLLLLVQTGRASELAAFNARLADSLERRRRLEEQREQLIAELELRNVELERFSYTVSHDLKSPLVTIKGYLGLLERDLEAGRRAEVESDLGQLHRAADRMRELVDDLLELSRAGHAVGPAENLALDEVVSEVVAQTAVGAPAGGVRIEVAPGLPRVRANRGQLLEVFQNLVDNAVKFTDGCPDPLIEIGAAVQGDRVVCHVRDNGIGLDPAHRERIFGLFTRLDSTRTGTGVGLALVRRIVEMSGGSVWVESAGEGQGSTFYFTLNGA